MSGYTENLPKIHKGGSRILILLLLVMLLLAGFILSSMTSLGGGQTPNWRDKCPADESTWNVPTALLESSVAEGVGYFLEGGLFFGTSPDSILRTADVAERIYGTRDLTSLTRPQQQEALRINNRIGDARARFDEWQRGDCWSFKDPSLMGKIVNLFQ